MFPARCSRRIMISVHHFCIRGYSSSSRSRKASTSCIHQIFSSCVRGRQQSFYRQPVKHQTGRLATKNSDGNFESNANIFLFENVAVSLGVYTSLGKVPRNIPASRSYSAIPRRSALNCRSDGSGLDDKVFLVCRYWKHHTERSEYQLQHSAGKAYCSPRTFHHFLGSAG